jgi:uncharacterized protein YkwD
LAACAADDGQVGSQSGGIRVSGCQPGAQLACACSNGSGVATCGPSGIGYGPCNCGAAGQSADVVAPGAAQPTDQPGAGDPGSVPGGQVATGEGVMMGEPVAMDMSPEPTAGAAGGAAPVPVDDPSQATTGDSIGDPAPVDDSVPEGDYCAATEGWDPAWASFEEEVLRLTNEARAMGADCGTGGSFGPAEPLTMNPTLRCAARLHSADMGEQGFFAHEGLDGRTPFDRMADAGYVGRTMGENIAKGQQSPAEVVAGWMDSDGHCSNIMNPSFTEIGIGYWEGPADNQFFNGNKLWTQNFGAPGSGGGGGSAADFCQAFPQFCM